MVITSKFKTAFFATALLGATALTTAAVEAQATPASPANVEAKHTSKLAVTARKEVEGTKADLKEDKAEAHKKADAVEDTSDALKLTAKKADAVQDKAEAKAQHARVHSMAKEKSDDK